MPPSRGVNTCHPPPPRHMINARGAKIIENNKIRRQSNEIVCNKCYFALCRGSDGSGNRCRFSDRGENYDDGDYVIILLGGQVREHRREIVNFFEIVFPIV